MLNRVFLVALYAGLAAGLLVAVLQHFTTTPLILKAEVYERASSASVPTADRATSVGPRAVLVHAHGDRGESLPVDLSPAQGAPTEPERGAERGLERTIHTSVATIVTAVGFALMLLAGMIAAGDPIEPRRALGWGAAAFLATGLAPALGLAPELPGGGAGDPAARQLWWIVTTTATGLALWLIVRTSAWLTKLLG